MDDRAKALLILVLFNALAFIFAALLARVIRHFGKREGIRPFRWGAGGVVLVTAFMVGIVLRELAHMPDRGAAQGGQAVSQGLSTWQVVGHALLPGLIVLVVAWLVARLRKSAASKDVVSNDG